MGMYTEFVFGAKLRKDTPKLVIEILKRLCSGEQNYDDITLPHNAFFECSRWKWIATSSSCYFGAPANSVIIEDECQHTYSISIRANLKNYDNEIDKFIKWILLWIEQGSGRDELLGYSMYEENTEPTMYYLRSKGAEW